MLHNTKNTFHHTKITCYMVWYDAHIFYIHAYSPEGLYDTHVCRLVGDHSISHCSDTLWSCYHGDWSPCYTCTWRWIRGKLPPPTCSHGGALQDHHNQQLKENTNTGTLKSFELYKIRELSKNSLNLQKIEFHYSPPPPPNTLTDTSWQFGSPLSVALTEPQFSSY